MASSRREPLFRRRKGSPVGRTWSLNHKPSRSPFYNSMTIPPASLPILSYTRVFNPSFSLSLSGQTKEHGASRALISYNPRHFTPPEPPQPPPRSLPAKTSQPLPAASD